MDAPFIRYGIEERFGEFPFVLEQQFKLAIAITPKEFRFAVDGVYFTSFIHRSDYGIEKLNGFKMGTSYGMYGNQFDLFLVSLSLVFSYITLSLESGTWKSHRWIIWKWIQWIAKDSKNTLILMRRSTNT